MTSTGQRRRSSGRAGALLDLRIFQNQLVSVAEEMGQALMRTAFSPNIKERRDFSCAVFDAAGQLLAQAAHIPVHLGAMPLAVRAARAAVARWRPGDVVALNDPYAGGTHLPDLTMVSPVFQQTGRVIGFVASRAHQADIGGMSPGSMPLATELFQEGLIIPPVKLVDAGDWNRGVLDLILRNVRTPAERLGDLDAQVAAHRTGERRLREVHARYGAREATARARRLIEHAERLTRASIRRIPAGRYAAVDYLDGDGFGAEQIPLHVTVTVSPAGDLRADFAGTAPAVAGPVNAVAAVTSSAVYYCVRCLSEDDLPMNEGALRPIEVAAPEGSLVNARHPHAVCAGNVETSQRIVDVVFAALAAALPDRIPAASQGTMNNLTLGGVDPRSGQPFAYYETIGGGAGGGPAGPGLSGIHVHMSNTWNTPVEALEYAYPVRVVEYSLRPLDDHGAGASRGGRGLRRVYALSTGAAATLLTERRTNPPPGLRGGAAGAPGRNWLQRATGGGAVDLPPKATVQLEPGDLLGIETPGGGGWGAPRP